MNATSQRKYYSYIIHISKITLTITIEYPATSGIFASLLEPLYSIHSRSYSSYSGGIYAALPSYLNIATEYYALPKNTLKEDIPLSTSVKELAKLYNESNLEKTFHILNEDDR